MNEVKFKKRKTIEQVEESTELAPKFDKDGLIPVITTDFSSGEVLMQGYMNEEALKKTSGRRHHAAKLLGWGRNTLARKIKELNLDL